MTPRKSAHFLGILALALAAAPGIRAALWVSAGGDDANPGTEEQPVRTIVRARDIVRTLNAAMTDDITVFIAGESHLDQAIEFGPEDSGTNGFNIIYTAAPGEHPILSGGFRVTGWTLADKGRNLWSAPAPRGLATSLSLYVNGTPASRTHGRLLQVFSKNSAGGPASPSDPKTQWKNPGDVVFVPPGPGSIWSESSAAAPLFVENAFELLGMPGEWYFDRPARLVYYTPRVGEEMTTAEVVAASSVALVVGRGSKEHPLTGIIFKGIGFEYTAASRPADASPESTVSQAVPSAAVSFSRASGIQLLEDEFLHMSTPALELGPAVEGATVEGCVFGSIAWTALRVSGATQVRIAQSRFSYVSMEHSARGAIELDRSDEVVVEGNQIDHFPTVAIQSTGEKPGAVREESSLVSQPMIGIHGGRPRDSDAQPPDAGIPPAYRSLLNVRFSALTTPRPPSHVSAEPEDKLAYVTWVPSCQDGGAPVLFYTVASSTGATVVVSAGDFQARGYVALDGLENGHGVTFAVSAANRIGSSPPSPPTANVTPSHKKRLKPPEAPGLVTVNPVKGGSIIEITPPGSDGGSPVVAYALTPAPGAEAIMIEGLDVIHADATHPVKRTIPDMSLDPAAAVVTARNAAGDGPPALVRPRR